MAITDELREYAEIVPRLTSDLTAIADRIDSAHERQLETLYHDMSDAEYVKLPKDADGEPIHVGDVMKGEKIGGGFCEPFEVVGYIMSNGELELMDEHKCPRKHEYLHHHRQQTVEDVMREFALACEDAGNAGPEVARLAAEYAKRLKLAGEGNE